jgi:hypothetical protein
MRRGYPIHDQLFKALHNLSADCARLQPWFPYPKLSVAELRAPERGMTFWDFTLMDQMTEDFKHATAGHLPSMRRGFRLGKSVPLPELRLISDSLLPSVNASAGITNSFASAMGMTTIGSSTPAAVRHHTALSSKPPSASQRLDESLKSGRRNPGYSSYSGNFLDGSNVGSGGWVYQFRDAFAVEPQHFPDSPNHPNFPSVILKPGETYHNTIVYCSMLDEGIRRMT